MNKLKDNYKIRLRCATCGCEDQFEFNDDKSYIKCIFCNIEYFGGIEELKELNQEAFDDVKEEMEKVRKFDQTSRIIDSLDQKKMKSLENMLNEMFNETKTENIQQFIDYFIKSCEEYKTFQDTIKTLSSQVIKLEKEVDELEYILNFPNSLMK